MPVCAHRWFAAAADLPDLTAVLVQATSTERMLSIGNDRSFLVSEANITDPWRWTEACWFAKGEGSLDFCVGAPFPSAQQPCLRNTVLPASCYLQRTFSRNMATSWTTMAASPCSTSMRRRSSRRSSSKGEPVSSLSLGVLEPHHRAACCRFHYRCKPHRCPFLNCSADTSRKQTKVGRDVPTFFTNSKNEVERFTVVVIKVR